MRNSQGTQCKVTGLGILFAGFGYGDEQRVRITQEQIHDQSSP